MSDSIYTELRADVGRRWAIALIAAGAQLLLFSLLFFAAIGKIIEFGWYGHIQHFTNWSWSLQALFYFVTLPAPFVQVGLIREDSSVGRFVQFVLAVFFFPLVGIIFVVVVVVSVLLGTNSPFLTDIFTKLPPTIVMLGNDVFHFWPVIFILLFYLAYRRLIHFSLNHAMTYTGVLTSGSRTTLFIVWEAYFAPGATIFVYAIIFDPHEVYKTDVWTGSGVVVAFITLTVFDLIPLMIILGLERVGTNVAYPVRWLFYNDSDPELAAATFPPDNSAIKRL